MRTLYISLIVAFLPTIILMDSTLSNATDDDTIVVVVNSRVAVDTISLAEVRRLFLRQRSTFRDGKAAVPVNAKAGTRLRKIFAKKVLGMDESSETIYWQNKKIKLGKSAPPEFSNTQEAVYALDGAIGYCFKSEHLSTVNKVVLEL